MRTERYRVDGMDFAASVSGSEVNPAILLIHGWPHSRALYDPVVDRLGERFQVLAFDLPEIGDSVGTPPSAEKHCLADLLLTAAEGAGARSPVLAGIDVGGMIAFAAARDHRSRIKGAMIGNTVIPGLDPWHELISDPRIWHFAFHNVPNLPELLVTGRERTYFDFFFNFLGSKSRPLRDEFRDKFARAYSRPEALKAGFDWYRAFEADAKRNAAHRRIDVPILYFRGDADGRTPDPYIAGLQEAGVRDLRSEVVAATAEFTPLEEPQRFADMVAEFADQCTAREEALI